MFKSVIPLWVYLLCSIAWGGVNFKSSHFELYAELNKPYELDLSTLLEDMGDGNLTWAQHHLPSWLELHSPTQKILGTPAMGDVGKSVFRLMVQDQSDSGAIASAEIRVVGPPKWMADPIHLGFYPMGSQVEIDLRAYVEAIGEGEMQFSATDLPAWVSLVDGVLSGTPQQADVGEHQLGAIEALFGEFRTPTSAKLSVVQLSSQWEFSESAYKFAARAGETLKIDVSKLILVPTDSDCVIRMVEQPGGADLQWLVLENEFILEGVVPVRALGTTRAQLLLRCDEKEALTELQIQVDAPADGAITIQAKEREVTKAMLPVPQNANPTFKLLSPSSWLKLYHFGELEIRPTREHLGEHHFRYRVTYLDGEIRDGGFTVNVIQNPRPPKWLESPMRASLVVGEEFSVSLSDKAIDVDGSPIKFSLINPPMEAFVSLSLSDSGVLTGSLIRPVSELKLSIRVANEHGLVSDNVLLVEGKAPVVLPKWKSSILSLPDAFESELYTFDLNSLVENPSGFPLEFWKISGAEWMTVNATGTVRGVPNRDNVGVNEFRVAFKHEDMGAIAALKVNVIKVDPPPVWSIDPIDGGTAYEDTVYSFDLSRYAVDFDGAGMSFRMLSGPSWLTLSSNGKLSGTPSMSDIGAVTAVVEVCNELGGCSQAGFMMTVLNVNHPPQWVMDPLILTIRTGEEKRDISGYVQDPDSGDRLVFSLVDAPEWIKVNSNGVLRFGTTLEQTGMHSFHIQVTDGIEFARVRVNLTVVSVSHPPKWKENPLVLPSAFTGQSYAQRLSDAVIDPDGDVLSFTLLSGPSWLSLTSSGTAVGVPWTVGKHVFEVRVSDGIHSADTTMILTVESGNQSPLWKESPLDLGSVPVGTALSFDASERCEDPDGDPLRFSKVSGADWMQVGSAGLVVGVPRRLGQFAGVIQCTDGKSSVDVVVMGHVVPRGD